MKHKMQKSFLIQAQKFKEISEGKGILEYRLVDENGDARIITATAKTGIFRKLCQIKAVYKREAPLVKVLRKASTNDTVHVDFTKFNKKNIRPKLTESAQSVTNDYSSNTAVFDSVNLIRLFGIAVIGFIVLIMMKFFL